MNSIIKRAFWDGSAITSKTIKHNNVRLVFGSNPHGNHGAGVAKIAHLYWGAVYYKGRGLYGDSYALVIKNLRPNYFEKETGLVYEKTGYKSISKELIKNNIKELYAHCNENPNYRYVVPYLFSNRNLNGYSTSELSDLFLSDLDVPINIVFHNSWKKFF